MVSQLQKNIINFVLGGLIIVGIGNLALYVNSTAAALLWSFPILSIPAYIYIYLETNNRKLLKDLNSDIIIFFFVNLSFFGFVYCLVEYTKLNVLTVIIISLFLYLVLALIVYYFVRKLKRLELL